MTNSFRFFWLVFLLQIYQLEVNTSDSFENINPIFFLENDNYESILEMGKRTPLFIYFKLQNCVHCKNFDSTFDKVHDHFAKKQILFAISNADKDEK